MISFDLHINNFQKDTFLNKDLEYLESLISGAGSADLYKALGEENWHLWNQKGKIEELLVKDLYNLELNFKAYAFEVAICRRVSILKALENMTGRGPVSLFHAFSIFPPDIMIEELIRPIDEDTINNLGKTPEIFGRGYISPLAKEAGNMKPVSFDEHDEVLYYWLKAREKGIIRADHILLHFDAHSDMLCIDRDDLQILNSISGIEEFKNYISTFYFREPGENLLTPVNLVSFIYFAVKSNIVREVFWVFPDPDYSKYRLPANLDLLSLLDIDGGENFRLEDGHIVCDWAGVKIHILRLSDIPVFNEEVILDIDLDFFLNESSADERTGCRGYRVWDRKNLDKWKSMCNGPLKLGQTVPWITPEAFIEMISAKGIYSLISTICRSPFFTAKEFHFLLDILKEQL